MTVEEKHLLPSPSSSSGVCPKRRVWPQWNCADSHYWSFDPSPWFTSRERSRPLVIAISERSEQLRSELLRTVAVSPAFQANCRNALRQSAMKMMRTPIQYHAAQRRACRFE
jgi:hypothetical protein